MIVGAYWLDLYCDLEESEHVGGMLSPHRYNEFPHQFVAQAKREAFKQARSRGWKFRKGLAICPDCNAESIRRCNHKDALNS